MRADQKAWTAQEDAELTRMHGERIRIDLICARLGRPYAGVSNRISRLGLAAGRGNRKRSGAADRASSFPPGACLASPPAGSGSDAIPVFNSLGNERPEGRKRLQVHREPRNAAEPDAGQPKREEVGTERRDPGVTAGETAPPFEDAPRHMTFDEAVDLGGCLWSFDPIDVPATPDMAVCGQPRALAPYQCRWCPEHQARLAAPRGSLRGGGWQNVGWADPQGKSRFIAHEVR